MSHATINILSAVVMFGHAVLGCCCHHAHGSSDGCQHVAGIDEVVSRDADCHAGRHAAVGRQAVGTQHGRSDDHRPCDEKRCTYVVTKPVKVSGLTMSAAHGAMPVPMLSLPVPEIDRDESAAHRSPLSAPQVCAVLGVFRL